MSPATTREGAATLRERFEEVIEACAVAAGRRTSTPPPAATERYRRHLSHAIESLDTNTPDLLARQVAWEHSVLERRGTPADELSAALDDLQDAVTLCTGAVARAALAPILDHAKAALSGVASHPAPPDLKPLARSYLDLLLAGRHREAGDTVLRAAEAGTHLRDLYLEVFQPTLQEIGRLWQINAIGVAEEHYCTAAIQLALSQLYPYLTREPVRGRTAVVTSTEGNLHELGARMVADFLEMDGWDAYFLGANTPPMDVVSAVGQRRAALLGLSISMVTQLDAGRRAIRALRAEPGLEATLVMVGGPPFRDHPELARQIGADFAAANAEEAVVVANRAADRCDRRSES